MAQIEVTYEICLKRKKTITVADSELIAYNNQLNESDEEYQVDSIARIESDVIEDFLEDSPHLWHDEPTLDPLEAGPPDFDIRRIEVTP